MFHCTSGGELWRWVFLYQGPLPVGLRGLLIVTDYTTGRVLKLKGSGVAQTRSDLPQTVKSEPSESEGEYTGTNETPNAPSAATRNGYGPRVSGRDGATHGDSEGSDPGVLPSDPYRAVSLLVRRRCAETTGEYPAPWRQKMAFITIVQRNL